MADRAHGQATPDMSRPPARRSHPAQRARTAATLVAAGTTVALVAVMGVTRHAPGATTGGAISTGNLTSGDDSQSAPSTPDYLGAVPAYPAPAAHTRTHGS